LLTPRPLDSDEEEGFHEWDFNSVHFWGESPKGLWTLFIADKTSDELSGYSGAVLDAPKLGVFGTREKPKWLVERQQQQQ